MLNTSIEYNNAIIADTRYERVTGTLTLPSTTVININNDNIVGNSLYIEEQILPSDDFTTGNCDASELGVKLIINENNVDGGVILLDYQIGIPFSEPTIGSNLYGGKIAYIYQSNDLGYDSDYIKGIVVKSTNDVGIWSSVTNGLVGTTSQAIGEGQNNTNEIDATDTSGIHNSANLYTDGTYSDWYIPSKNELQKIYDNRVTIGGFTTEIIWSSSESSATNAYALSFQTNNWSTFSKGDIKTARYVRTFSIPKWSEKIPLGKYYINSSKRVLDYVDIVAYNGMSKWNTKTGTTLSTRTNTSQITYMAGLLGETLATTTADFNKMVNSAGFILDEYAKVDTSNLTSRDILIYCCQQLNVYGRYNRYNKLELKKYHSPYPNYILEKNERFRTKIEEGIVKIARTEISSNGVLYGRTTSTNMAIGYGLSNTNKIIAQNGSSVTYSAKIAQAYNGGGFSDWYLPSAYELKAIYEGLGLNNSANRTIYGFTSTYYWSSSEKATNGSTYAKQTAYNVQFVDSPAFYLGDDTKATNNYVRAIRNYTSVTPRANGYDTGWGYIFYRFPNTDNYLVCSKVNQSTGAPWATTTYDRTDLSKNLGSILSLYSNPFFDSKRPFQNNIDSLIDTMINDIANELVDVTYRPFEIEMTGNPALEAGDWIQINNIPDTDDNIVSLITHSRWTFRGKHRIRGTGVSTSQTTQTPKYESDISQLKATGIIQESGSDYIKYADGTLECWTRVVTNLAITTVVGNLFSSAAPSLTWTFPVQFINTDNLVVTGQMYGANISAGGIVIYGTNSSSCTYRLWNSSSQAVADPRTIMLRAIGKWK